MSEETPNEETQSTYTDRHRRYDKRKHELEGAALRVARWEAEVVDIDQEYQALLAIARHMRMKIQREWSDNPDWKLPKGLIEAMREVTTIFDRLTACEVRLEKTRTQRASKMTLEECLEAAGKLILAQEPTVRTTWFHKYFPGHTQRAEAKVENAAP